MVRHVPEPSTRSEDVHSGDADILSPMPGAVIAVHAATGDTVSAGTAIVVVEAMKMEHALVAPIDGTAELAVAVGDQVRVDQLLARIVPTETAKEHP